MPDNSKRVVGRFTAIYVSIQQNTLYFIDCEMGQLDFYLLHAQLFAINYQLSRHT